MAWITFGAAALLVAMGAVASEQAREPGLTGRDDILYSEDFENSTTVGTTTEDPQRVKFGRRSLKVMYKGGKHGTEGEPKIQPKLPKLDQFYVRHYVMFEEGFDFAAGGKLTGSVNFAPGKRYVAGFGGKPAHGDDGFSCRVCWMTGGRIIMYTYHADMKGTYGDHFPTKAQFKPGVWQCVELMIKLNTPGKAAGEKGANDGEIKLWVDGELAGEKSGIRFRDIPELALDSWDFGFYFGGTWTCPKNQYVYLDNVVIARNCIGPLRQEVPKPPSTIAAGLPAKPAPAAAPAAKIPVTALTPWQEKLRVRVAQGIQAGEKPVAYLNLQGAREEPIKIVGADEKGLRIDVQGNAMPLAWSRLTPRDSLNLARALLKAGVAEDHLLVAVFALADGRAELAEEHFAQAQASDPQYGAARVLKVRETLRGQ